MINTQSTELLFELSHPGRRCHFLPASDVPAEHRLPKSALAEAPPPLPEIAEIDLVRHFTNLSQQNMSIDTNFYPLGSCTMKYNPKSSEALARIPGFANAHPLLPAGMCQGSLELMFELERALSEISGFTATTLAPAAGAQGELTGVMMIRAYHVARGNARKKVLIPDTAHGTNPATSALNGYDVVQLASGPDGRLHPEAVAAAMDEDVAAIMITNPNTLGIFETHIAEIARIVHAKGGLVYGDGANLNALLGVARPGDMGVDVMQFNLHKTFSTPHGGGGPGAGPVGVKTILEPYLPTPRLARAGDGLRWSDDLPQSIGRVRSFYGNFGMLVRAYAYMLALGGDGLAEATRTAVLSANYIRKRLEGVYHVAYPRLCMHECVL
jgi:glycine dehydrogenase subunit 2